MSAGSIDIALAPEVALAHTRHGPLFVLKSDSTIGRSLLDYGEWTEGEIDAMRQIVRPNDCVVDIGANVGSHTVALAKLVASGGYVMAFEPHPKVFQLLCANVVVNGVANVRCFAAACGGQAGGFQFPELDYASEINFGAVVLSELEAHRQAGKIKMSQPVPIVTLDETFDLPSLRFVKIDAEGMEFEVLKGAERTIRRFRPVLYIENEKPEKSERLLHAVLDLDYVIYWHVVPLFNPGNFRGSAVNVFPNIACINNICLPKEAGFKMHGLEEVTDACLHPRRQ